MNDPKLTELEGSHRSLRALAIVLLALAFVVVLCASVIPKAILALLCDREMDRKVLDAQTDFYCPSGNQVVYDGWSECGLKKECINPKSGMTDGSFFAAHGGQLNSKSLYSQGKKTGGWTWYDNDRRPQPEDGGYQVTTE